MAFNQYQPNLMGEINWDKFGYNLGSSNYSPQQSYVPQQSYSVQNPQLSQPSSGGGDSGMSGTGMSIGGAFTQLGTQIHEDVLEGFSFFSNLGFQEKAEKRAQEAHKMGMKTQQLQNRMLQNQLSDYEEQKQRQRRFAAALGTR